MQIGRIKWFNKSKAFGFVEQEDGRNILFDATSLKAKLRAGLPLRPGTQVRFQLEERAEGPRATDIELLGDQWRETFS